MKNFPKIFIILFLSVSFLFGGAIIQFFVADSNGDNIVLTWQSTSEQNVKHYEILRGPDKDHLTVIDIILSKGDNSNYSYTDENAYKTTNSFYAYGLVIVDNDGSKSEPMHTFVTHNGVSSVKRTWGSIKALFR
ncbi:MAG: hypothetical protein KDC88_05800 [Ignavibacteriae bacterium]|nr:hypothetical protein [Ignavibacteriota bacterium]